MVRLVESRANQVGHARIDQCDLPPGGVLFGVEYPGYQLAALRDERTPEFKMHRLPRFRFQRPVHNAEIAREIRYGFAVRIVIADSQSPAEIQVLQFDALFHEPLLDFVDFHAEIAEYFHIRYL